MKKLVAILVIIATMLTSCTGGCSKEDPAVNTPETPVVSETKEEVKEETKDEKMEGYEETGEMVDAYDFIIETMNKPQYWSDEDWLPVMSRACNVPDSEYYESRGVDRTAWTLLDEETATFQRAGLTRVLTICFSEYKAILTLGAGQTSGYKEKGYDYVNEPLRILSGEEPYVFCGRIFENGAWRDETEAEGYRFALVFDFKNDEFYQFGSKVGVTFPMTRNWKTGKVGDAEVIRRCFDEYNELFEAAGCPLVNMPKGTLSKYKGVEIPRIKEVDDGLIHAIWEQDGFVWKQNSIEVDKIPPEASWVDSPDTVWLDDYRDIQFQKAPVSDYREKWTLIDEQDVKHDLNSAPYSPVFLVLASERDNIVNWQNNVEYFATYYLAPLMKHIYGYNAVYFVNRDEIPEVENNYACSFLTKEEFERGLRNEPAISTILNQGNEYVSGRYSANTISGYDSFDGEDEGEIFVRYLNRLCKYYGVENPFGDDYVYNFNTIFDSDTRVLLGLI